MYNFSVIRNAIRNIFIFVKDVFYFLLWSDFLEYIPRHKIARQKIKKQDHFYGS